eukprot:gene7390-9755_t
MERLSALSTQRLQACKDNYGSFIEYHIRWNGTKFGVETSFRVYRDNERIGFTQSWLSGADDTAAGTPDNVLSSFPSFDLTHKPPIHLGAVSWFGEFIDNGFLGPSVGTWPDGIEGGRGCGPIALFDRDTDDVIVFAPASEFMIASLEKTTTALRAGILGSVQSVPSEFSVSFTLTFHSDGINNGMMKWGHALLSVTTHLRTFAASTLFSTDMIEITVATNYGKRTDGLAFDFTLQYLGYNTDHGAYYCE